MLWNSCPCMTYPTFSSLPIDHPISPSTNSSHPRTDARTHPHLSPTSRPPKRNPVPIIDTSSCFTFLVFDPLCSSTGPSVRWSPFRLSYVFLFRFRSCSTFGYAAPTYRSISPFDIVRLSIPFSHWFSDVVAYPEPYLELQSSLRPVLYKVARPLVCSLASSTQSSLVSSLPRFALRPSRLKPSLHRNGSLRTLRLFVRSSLGYSTLGDHIW